MNENIKQLLEELGFKETKPGMFTIQRETGVIGVNFTKHPKKGEPFAMENGVFYDDLTGIKEINDFIKRRDEILQSSSDVERQKPGSDNEKQQGSNETKSSLDAGQKETFLGEKSNTTIIPSPSGVKLPSAPTSNLLKVIKEDYEADILEIFGDSGACKTKLAVLLALEGKRDGKKVRFVDTERNLRKAEIASLGDSYQYLPGINDLDNFCKKLPQEPEIIIIDSVGYPILTEWARMKSEDKGNALTKLIAWKGDLKDWAINNNKLAIITNQPDSDFMKGKDYINRPFGDKARFASKEIWVLERLGMQKGITRSAIKTFRSRIKGYGLDVAQIEINDGGTFIKGI